MGTTASFIRWRSCTNLYYPLGFWIFKIVVLHELLLNTSRLWDFRLVIMSLSLLRALGLRGALPLVGEDAWIFQSDFYWPSSLSSAYLPLGGPHIGMYLHFQRGQEDGPGATSIVVPSLDKMSWPNNMVWLSGTMRQVWENNRFSSFNSEDVRSAGSRLLPSPQSQ